MKVGTDGVLLGAWTDVSGTGKILDVGAGTGVISLMLAQRSHAAITGIEIEKNAAEEAAENACNSPWSHRVNIQHIAFQDFVHSNTERFDLIVSNPPFFTNSQKPECSNLAMAKHNHLLPLPFLAAKAAKLLTPSGRLAVIIPASAVREFINSANDAGLFLSRETVVRPNNLKKVHRSMMEFAKTPGNPVKDSLNIHTDDGLDFTEAYKMLTRDFYLNF